MKNAKTFLAFCRFCLYFIFCLSLVVIWPVSALAIGEGVGVWLTSVQSISSSTWTALSFGDEMRDDANFWSISNPTKLVVSDNKTGWYVISGCVGLSAVVPVMYIEVVINNTYTLGYWRNDSGIDMCLSIDYYLYEDDYIELYVWQNLGSSVNATSSTFRMVRVSGETLCGVDVDCSSPARYDQYLKTRDLGGANYVWDVTSSFHALSHQDGGGDEISVGGLVGVLQDYQRAGWLLTYPITNAPSVSDVLIYNGSYWVPGNISSTGGLTMPEFMTVTISGVVPVNVLTPTQPYSVNMAAISALNPLTWTMTGTNSIMTIFAGGTTMDILQFLAICGLLILQAFAILFNALRGYRI